MPGEIIDPIEKPIIKTAGMLTDEAYAKLAVTFADTVSKDVPVVTGSREQEVACAKLILEKQKAEEQEELKKEVSELDLSKAHIKKVDAGLSDVVYEVRVFGVREPLNE